MSTSSSDEYSAVDQIEEKSLLIPTSNNNLDNLDSQEVDASEDDDNESDDEESCSRQDSILGDNPETSFARSEVEHESTDEEDVLTAVVVNEDEEGLETEEDSTVAEAVAVQVSRPRKQQQKNISGLKKTKHTLKRRSGKVGKGSFRKEKMKGKRNAFLSTKKIKMAKTDKKSKLLKENNGTADDADPFGSVSPAIAQAANDARAMLRETVPVLPFPIADTQVRSLGRLRVEDEANSNRKKFCSATNLFPVGFSCDRSEFSPVHGRSLKMRCTILDSTNMSGIKEEGSKVRKARPLFRVMWGQGLDDDPERDSEYPYDPNIHSPPMFAATKSSLVNAVKYKSENDMSIKLERGMPVKVRVDDDKFFRGRIVEVSPVDDKISGQCEVTVGYEHGLSETFQYPDPDLQLLIPGMFSRIY